MADIKLTAGLSKSSILIDSSLKHKHPFHQKTKKEIDDVKAIVLKPKQAVKEKK
jgi:hypothetical protein